MAYTGEVSVGGTPDTHELQDLIVTKVAVGPLDNNAYVLRCRATGEQVLIDAAAEPDTLLEVIGGDGLTAVVTTHRHGDHWQALSAVVEATGARTYAGREDAAGIPVPTDVAVDDGDTIPVGRVTLTARHLVGHTPGSIALVYDDPHGHPHVFTGDCLFPGGVGNTHDDPAAFASLLDGVSAKLFDVLPDETWVYPGHGKDTTLGAERPHVPEWRARGW
jgi:glyoxylase-like metal-dependent hydrolase (beta-lactamase superfamily II)